MANNRNVTREERLAAKLRENLHRRKAQARALDADARTTHAGNDDAGDPGRESGERLPKPRPSR